MAAWFLPVASAVVGGLFSANANKKQNKSNQKAQDQQNAENERVRLLQNEENRRVAALERQQAEADFARDRALAEQDDATRFQRLRDSAQSAGFNPNSALQFGGTTGALSPFVNMPSGVSADGYSAKGFTPNKVFDWGGTVVNALNAAIPEISGQAGVARQREQLEQDLLRAQADSLRMPAVGAIGGGVSSGGSSGGYSSASFPPVSGGLDLAPGRPVVRKPTENISGLMQIENAVTGDTPAWVWGSDGDPWDVWQHLAVWGQVAPQIVSSAPIFADSFSEMFSIQPNGVADRVIRSVSGAISASPITVHQPAHSSGRPLMSGAHSSGRP